MVLLVTCGVSLLCWTKLGARAQNGNKPLEIAVIDHVEKLPLES
jgi:hypothetical protein